MLEREDANKKKSNAILMFLCLALVVVQELLENQLEIAQVRITSSDEHIDERRSIL